MYGRALWTILIGLIIPAIGVVVAQAGLGSLAGGDAVSGALLLEPSASEAAAACAAGRAGGPLCAEADRLSWLRLASYGTAAILIGIVLLFLLLALIAGTSRWLNSAIFPPLVPIATLTIGALVFVHGAMVTYCVYLLEVWFGGQTWYVFSAAAGVGAMIGAVSVMSALRSANQEQAGDILARAVSRADQPQLWAYVDGIADKLGARKPDHILIGLEPTFFVTAAPIRPVEADAPLYGETMFLSAPLMRLFTENQLRAVVAHELGHFRGEDVQYSLRFEPTFRSLVEAIRALEGDDGRADWVMHAPGALVLRFMLEAIGRNRSRISRVRELAADQASLEAADPRGIGLALAKSVVFGLLWRDTWLENANRLREGKISPNLARVFEKSAVYDVSHQAIGDVLTQVMAHKTPHPTDTHPPIGERYAAVGFDAQTELTIEALTEVGGVSQQLFQDLEALERDLTVIEHKSVLSAGVVSLPEQGEDIDPILEAAYVLAVCMVGADGSVDPQEMAIAEGIGGRLFQNFDNVTFRERFEQLDDLPSFDSAAAILDEILVAENKRRVLAFLMEIAAADGRLHERERELLSRAALRWDIRRPLTLRLPGREEPRESSATAVLATPS
ncbi:MAG: M48 family metalloprotease [Pseudomonadota bacterium]